MIKFTPLHSDKKEIDFCDNMNRENSRVKCVRPACKHTETGVAVSAVDSSFNFQIINPCCDEFKGRLEKILGIFEY